MKYASFSECYHWYHEHWVQKNSSKIYAYMIRHRHNAIHYSPVREHAEGCDVSVVLENVSILNSTSS